MHLPAMLLVVCTLIVSAIANPVPSIATENDGTSDVSVASDRAPPGWLAITFCFDPDHHCLAIDQEADHCTPQKDFSQLKGIGMDIGIYCDVFPNDKCDSPGVQLGNTVDIHGSGVNFPIKSTRCWDSRTKRDSRSVTTEVVHTANVSIASDNGVPARLSIEFCWRPEVHQDCLVMTHFNQQCMLEQYLNGLKSVHMSANQFCVFFSRANCLTTDDVMVVGSTDDIQAAGVNFPILSSWCYDTTLGPIVFPTQNNKRLIDTNEPATSSDSKDTAELQNSIAPQQDERLVGRDSSPTYHKSIHIIECLDDETCQDAWLSQNNCQTNDGRHDHLKGLVLPGDVYCQIFPQSDKKCKGDAGAKGVFRSTLDVVSEAPNLQFPIGSMSCWYTWITSASSSSTGASSIGSSNSTGTNI
ncbi:hypothetical protein EG328_001112 [Venturia inaequalis]|uniref:Uncharacterized protein n=1 Tax=Venturia inaequalis TaxID=5025 RepID=A0A8H3V0C8_VENIN|nr:hypothetical protein EG328_001112 [Venturia inaequalis]